ncbi:peptidase S41-like protein [Breznakibacter xylanolyticus]|uniref:Peptidase S41-like protein n=1 Tax=Breznakibacter xylanolyticus TaxID=990 RepID=A0A2W7NE18_9BACT|nr:S41 family peptidase [Breznakibacter xylanolyticus]PZX18665.1 peptidase S41-like protein [Breznakibacter xylanolyticus]
MNQFDLHRRMMNSIIRCSLPKDPLWGMRGLFALFLISLLFGCQSHDDRSELISAPVVFDSYWEAFTRHYAYMDETVNWDSAYAVHRATLTAQTPDDDLLEHLHQMVNLTGDAHTNVFAPLGTVGNEAYFLNFRTNQVELGYNYFDELPLSTRIYDYGRLRGGVAYLRVKTFVGEAADFAFIDTILMQLADAPALIVDVRGNRGGLLSQCHELARRFIDAERVVCHVRARNGRDAGDFSEWEPVVLSPSPVRWTKPMVVLTNRTCYSAGERFLVCLKSVPGVVSVGDTTGGGSGSPLVRELSNGWLMRTSNTQTRLLNGRDFQKTGIPPDVVVWISGGDARIMRDRILEEAVELLQGNAE